MADPNDPRLMAAANNNGTYGGGQMSADDYLASLGGGGATGGSTSGASLAKLFQPNAVTLPDTEGAKGSLRDLQLGGVSGLQSLLAQDPQAERAKLQKAIYDTAASDINYSADRAQRDALETQNGKNMLVSSATGDYFLEPMERARTSALEKASNDAFVNANTIGNANTAARLSTLGQAFNEGTTGLQGEANVGFTNNSQSQQGTEAGYQLGQQGDQFGKSLAQQGAQYDKGLAQQKDLTTQGFQNSRDIANSQGVASGLGGLAQLFAPNIRSAASSLGFG